MLKIINRSLSLIIVLIYLFIEFQGNGFDFEFIKTTIALALPLVCIWFGDELGEFTGVVNQRIIDSTSPGILVSTCGWVILIGIPIIPKLLTD